MGYKSKQPPCCQTCPHITRDGRCLSNDKQCTQWRAWFHEQWTAIQAAAEAYRRPQTPEPEAQQDEVQEEAPTPARRRPSVCVPKEDER